MCQRAAFNYCVTMLNDNRNICGVIIRDKTTNKLTFALCSGRCLENKFNSPHGVFLFRNIFYFLNGGDKILGWSRVDQV